jgi:hypothetical protein
MTDEGGCAFPLHGIDGVIDYGISVRDYFAGQAIAGMCAAYSAGKTENHEMMATASYAIADAMIKARSPQVSEHD